MVVRCRSLSSLFAYAARDRVPAYAGRWVVTRNKSPSLCWDGLFYFIMPQTIEGGIIMEAELDLKALTRKRDFRIILPVFLVSIIACLDRVNISYAALTMKQDLGWLTPEIYGAGAGIFFAGYLLLEIPGSLVAARFSASKWIARIMFTWGLVCVFMAFMHTQTEFYLCRFLLGASEASLYPVIYSVLFPRWFMGRSGLGLRA